MFQRFRNYNDQTDINLEFYAVPEFIYFVDICVCLFVPFARPFVTDACSILSYQIMFVTCTLAVFDWLQIPHKTLLAASVIGREYHCHNLYNHPTLPFDVDMIDCDSTMLVHTAMPLMKYINSSEVTSFAATDIL